MMKIEQKIELLREWQQKMMTLDDQLADLQRLMGSVDGPLLEAISHLRWGYTSALAQLVGDEPRDNWLEWYWIECDFGHSPKEASANFGPMILVDSVEKLAELIG